MKKTLFFGLIATALGFSACSSEDDAVLGENTQKKGMVLNATVEQPTETRATIDNAATDWLFDFENADEIAVTNSAISTYYTFTHDGTNFKSTEAQATASDANWYAYYPSNTIDLTNQAGDIDGVAGLYALAGAPASATTGASDLDIKMSAQVAILKIDNQQGKIDIQAKTSATDYVTGLTAKSGEAAFDVTTSTTETNLFSTSATGTYYVVVPAGVKIAIKDGAAAVKSTGTGGLTAGKYYSLTIAKPLTFTALAAGSTVSIGLGETLYRKSTDLTWAAYTATNEIELENIGDFVQFKADASTTAQGRNVINKTFAMTTGSFDASGSVMSLLGEGQNMGNKAFYKLFSGCSNLKTAPTLQLPATALSEQCYNMMFYNCTNLTTAPELPATEMKSSCYGNMFYKCSALTSAPELPATTLAASCYMGMFQECTSLTTAPALPATVLPSMCYMMMFAGCTKLTSMEVSFTSWNTGATLSWVTGVGNDASGTKTFKCPDALPVVRNTSQFPDNNSWEKVAK